MKNQQSAETFLPALQAGKFVNKSIKVNQENILASGIKKHKKHKSKRLVATDIINPLTEQPKLISFEQPHKKKRSPLRSPVFNSNSF